MSVDLDQNGNGFIFLPSNDYTEVLRLPVSGYKTIGTPARIELQATDRAGMCMHINRIEGTDDYILSGAAQRSRSLFFKIKIQSPLFNIILQIIYKE